MNNIVIPEDLKGLYANALEESGEPWHWIEVSPPKLIALIERIARLTAEVAAKEQEIAGTRQQRDLHYANYQKLDQENAALKIDIGHRSMITEMLQQELAALRQRIEEKKDQTVPIRHEQTTRKRGTEK